MPTPTQRLHPLTIRPATSDDLPVLVAIKVAAARRAYTFAPPAELEVWLAARATEASLADRLADPTGRLLVAERDGAVLGLAYVGLSGPNAKLSELYCTVDGSGAGAALMDARLAWARTAGAKRVTCYCFADNLRAQAFLARFGFANGVVVPASETLGSDLLFLSRPLP